MLILKLLHAGWDERTDAVAKELALDLVHAYGDNVLSLTYNLHIFLGC